MLKFLKKKKKNSCGRCLLLEEEKQHFEAETIRLKKRKDEYLEKLEKEVGYWKEKALNFKKFHL